MKIKNPYIFLVDDDQDDRDLFKEALDELRLGSEIATFENGVDLMANLFDNSAELPEMIFLDLNMPLMNGEECLNDIRSEPKFANIPIIIYSTYFDELKADLLQKKGADLYLRKPKSFKKLKWSIQYAIDALAQPKDQDADFVIR